MACFRIRDKNLQSGITEMDYDSGSFEWTIQGFIPFEQMDIRSPEFTSGDKAKLRWQLSLITTKKPTDSTLILGIYLKLVGYEDAESESKMNQKIKTRFQVRMSPTAFGIIKDTISHDFTKAKNKSGWGQFTIAAVIKEPQNLVIRCQIWTHNSLRNITKANLEVESEKSKPALNKTKQKSKDVSSFLIPIFLQKIRDLW